MFLKPIFSDYILFFMLLFVHYFVNNNKFSSTFFGKFLFTLKTFSFNSFFLGVFILAEVRGWRDFLMGLEDDPG